MKKLMNNKIFIIFVIIVLTITTGIEATNLYYASQVSYKYSDGNITSVNEALNNLYNLQNSGSKYNVVKLGGAGQYDLTSYDEYESFELNKNIFIVSNSMSMSVSVSTRDTSGGVSGSGSGSGSIYSATYNNGTLVVNNGSGSASGTLRDSYENVGSVTGKFSVSSVSVYLVY